MTEEKERIPLGTKIQCKLSASPNISHITTATLKKYCRVHGMQTVKDDKDPDPNRNKFYPVNIVEVEIPEMEVQGVKQEPFIARIDEECIVGVA